MKCRTTVPVVVVAFMLVVTAMAFGQADWTKRNPAHVPPARRSPAMAQFNQGEAVVMFGGETLVPDSFGKIQTVELDDTWVWDGSDWTQITQFGPNGNGPHPFMRSEAAMAYNPDTGMAVLFGGERGGSLMQDTWLFRLGKKFTFTSSGLKTTFFYEWILVNVTTKPFFRENASMAYDPVSKTMILTGGCCVPTNNPLGDPSWNDTWSFDPATNAWTQLAVTAPSREFSSLALCGNSVTTPLQLMLFGGAQGENIPLGNPFGDTWMFLSTLQWAGPQAVSSHPSARSGAGFAYYPVSNRSVLFGGLGPPNPGAFISNNFVGDTWSAFCSPASWSQQSPAHSPSARGFQGMTTGPNGFTLVLFGGWIPLANGPFPTNETWTWGRRVACLPADGSQLPVGSEVQCQFDVSPEVQFGGWKGNGFAPPFPNRVMQTFHTESPGTASITAQWSDSAGLHSETFSYVVRAKR